ncbi:MAG: LysR substrate-binding domain-containing protein [Pseudomonadota bacterium]
MQQNLPPLGWLRAFEAAARHLSFTHAARDLNMTQSAVSQQIKSLEGHIGRALFHRRPRALELTETGITYLPVVREAFRTLVQGTRAITGAEAGTVRLQCNLSFAIYWLAPRLHRLAAAHPEVRLNISTELWEPRELAEGSDVEIRYSLRPADTVRAELLARDVYFPVCAPNFAVTRDSLAAQPLFHCSNLLSSWGTWAAEAGIAWPDPPVTFATTYSVAMAAAEAGAGLTLTHTLIAQRWLDSGQLIAPFDTRVEMPEAYYLIMTPQAEASEAAQSFAAWLRAELALTAENHGVHGAAGE